MMIFSDLTKVVKKIETYYRVKLDDMEIKYLDKELKNFDLEKFKLIENEIFQKVNFFNINQVHNIINEFEERDQIKKSLGIKEWDEIYEN